MDTTTRQITLAIAGMTCASCTSKVQSSLSNVPGVEGATASPPWSGRSESVSRGSWWPR